MTSAEGDHMSTFHRNQLICIESTAVSLQRIYFDGRSPEYLGKYMYCHTTAGEIFVCKGTYKRCLHDRYLLINPCVQLTVPQIPSKSEERFVSKLEIIPKIKSINTLRINVIFLDTLHRVKWSNRKDHLQSTLNDILQLFCFSTASKINLGGFSEFFKLGFDSVDVINIGKEGIGKITPSSQIYIEGYYSVQSYDQLNRTLGLIDITGQEDVKSELCNILKFRQSRSSNSFFQQVLLIGPQGCGKITLTKQVCHSLKTVYINLNINEFSPEQGNENVDLNSKLSQADLLSHESPSGICVIIIPTIDILLSGNNQNHGQLLNLLDQCHSMKNILIVGTTDVPHLIPEEFRTASRFGVELYFRTPSEKERQDIVLGILKESIPNLECIGKLTTGYVMADLLLLCHKATKVRMKSNNKCSWDEAFNQAVKEIIPSGRKDVLGTVTEANNFSLSHLGGLTKVKNELIQSLEWPYLHKQSFKRLNIKPPTGILFYGPPGCAKTSLARAVSSLVRISFISVSAADLYSPYVGDSEKAIAHLFQRARANSPSVLFIDEIDALVGSRSSDEKKANEQVLTSFLTEMDGVGIHLNKEPSSFGKKDQFVFVIGATNRPDFIDSALLRPGRLDKLIYVPPPSNKERFEILQKITSNIPVSCDVSFDYLADNTENYSGADLVSLLNEAGLQAISDRGFECLELRMNDFVNALSCVKASLSTDTINWYSNFKFTT